MRDGCGGACGRSRASFLTDPVAPRSISAFSLLQPCPDRTWLEMPGSPSALRLDLSLGAWLATFQASPLQHGDLRVRLGVALYYLQSQSLQISPPNTPGSFLLRLAHV